MKHLKIENYGQEKTKWKHGSYGNKISKAVGYRDKFGIYKE